MTVNATVSACVSSPQEYTLWRPDQVCSGQCKCMGRGEVGKRGEGSTCQFTPGGGTMCWDQCMRQVCWDQCMRQVCWDQCMRQVCWDQCMRQVCWDQCMRQVCWDQCKWGGRGGEEYLSVHPRRRDYRQVCCTYEGRGEEQLLQSVTKCSPSEPPFIASGHGEATALMEAG